MSIRVNKYFKVKILSNDSNEGFGILIVSLRLFTLNFFIRPKNT